MFRISFVVIMTGVGKIYETMEILYFRTTDNTIKTYLRLMLAAVSLRRFDWSAVPADVIPAFDHTSVVYSDGSLPVGFRPGLTSVSPFRYPTWDIEYALRRWEACSAV